MTVVAFGMAAVCIFLTYALVHTKKSVARLKESVEDLLVSKGDVVRIRYTDKSVRELAETINLLSGKCSRYLQIVFDKCRLSVLFRSFFELVKVESEEDVVPRLERIDLTYLMVELEGEATEEADLCGMQLEVRRPTAPLYVWGVPSFLDRIMHNLLSNAFRYGKSGGYLGITLILEAGQVRIDIADRGPGISKHDIRTSLIGFIGESVRARRRSRGAVSV